MFKLLKLLLHKFDELIKTLRELPQDLINRQTTVLDNSFNLVSKIASVLFYEEQMDYERIENIINQAGIYGYTFDCLNGELVIRYDTDDVIIPKIERESE